MKTNVSIKFNSIEEYREIEKKLEELGYVNDKYWNTNKRIKDYTYIKIFEGLEFGVYPFVDSTTPIYNSLEEFLKD